MAPAVVCTGAPRVQPTRSRFFQPARATQALAADPALAGVGLVGPAPLRVHCRWLPGGLPCFGCAHSFLSLSCPHGTIAGEWGWSAVRSLDSMGPAGLGTSMRQRVEDVMQARPHPQRMAGGSLSATHPGPAKRTAGGRGRPSTGHAPLTIPTPSLFFGAAWAGGHFATVPAPRGGSKTAGLRLPASSG